MLVLAIAIPPQAGLAQQPQLFREYVLWLPEDLVASGNSFLYEVDEDGTPTGRKIKISTVLAVPHNHTASQIASGTINVLRLPVVVSVGNPGSDAYLPTEAAVRAAIDAGGGGNVTGPSSTTDGYQTCFNGVTGKIIKDCPTQLVIGSNVQAYSAVLSTYGNIAPSNDAQTLLGETFAQMLASIGAQASNPNLASISGLTWASLSLIQLTGVGSSSVLTCTGANQIIGVNAAANALECKDTISFSALNMPSSNADPGTTAGQIRHDSTVTNHANGAVRWWDGTNIRQMVDLVAATAEGCGDGYGVTYNASNDKFECTLLAPIRRTKCTSIKDPTATSDYPLEWLGPAATLKEVRIVVIGGTNIVGQFQECDANGLNCADTMTSDLTVVPNTVSTSTSFSDAAIATNAWVGWKTTSISGTPTSVHACFSYE